MGSIMKQKAGVSRRTFIASSIGTGLAMGYGSLLSGCSPEQAAESLAAGDLDNIFSPAVWFEIDGQGKVLVNIAKAEMGQHVGTALARIVADELGADWNDIQIKHVDTHAKWGYMMTGGSLSVFTSFNMLSQAGAAGRDILLSAGAKLLDSEPSGMSVSSGMVSNGEKSISFAEIVQRGDISRSFSAEELAALPVKAAADRQYIGKQSTALDIPEKATGQAVYGIDAELPGMVYAHALMPPTRYGSSITSIDDTNAKQIMGYQETLTLDDPSNELQGWALVIADTFPNAMKAAKAVQINWQAGPTAKVNEADLIGEGERLAADYAAGTLFVDEGDAPQARASADKVIQSVYRTSTALHFALEPANALVEFKDGKCHIHSGNQWQSLILPTLSKALDMPESDIIIHQYYLGGGFGRRLWGDYMIPAALAAKQLQKPVKLVFQRPDDSRLDCVRSASVQQFDASLDAQNNLTGIEHGAAAGWPTLNLAPGFLGDGVDGKGKFDAFSISGADHWYSLANHRVRAINNDLAQRTFQPGFLRAVGPGWVGWGVESFMDELAHAKQQDPIEFRLAMLDATGINAGKAPEAIGGAKRLAAVLKDVRDRSQWGREMPAGEALGVAVSHGQDRTMPTWTAVVAHVAVDADTNAITVKKIWQSIDCGTVVHPDGALAQAEGATLWGISLALKEGNSFENGEVSKTNLDTYTPLRMADVPEIDITFMPSIEAPTGLGEPPLIAIAPAIGNAVFSATGKRAYDLPISI
ncbi:MAG: isoquinoline 1-oxidoreductase beta subunit [Pseudoalteromonas tetraodonis]|jgi:isoquinoline 1-oxidoreductase beta subunit